MRYYLVWNSIVCLLYGFDKWRAIKNKRRLSENFLISLAFFGGGVGAFLGMRLFHHKTKKPKFRVLIPVFTVLNILLLWVALPYFF